MIQKIRFTLASLSLVVLTFSIVSMTSAQTPTPAPPTLANPTATSIAATSAILNSNITSTGGSNATSRGFNYGLTTAYGTTFNQTSGPYGTGAFSQFVPGLVCGTTYNFRSFATNAYGTRNSSNSTFTTSACPTPSATPNPAPTVSTNSAAGITNVSATLNGNISSTGGGSLTVSRRGFQYGESSYTNSVCEDGSFAAGSYSRSSGTTCGAVTATALSCGKNYIYRAFATNVNGTSYGSQLNFSTPSCPTPSSTVTATPTPTPTPSVVATPTPSGGPSLTLSAPSSVGSYSATLNANITALNGSNVTTRGFNFGSTLAYNQTVSQSAGPYSTGAYSLNITSLACDTTYYFRAFATNSSGTTYSNGSSIATEPCPTANPTPTNTATPTVQPTVNPTPTSTASPTVSPSVQPTANPTPTTTATPTVQPTVNPTPTSTASPSTSPSVEPTANPTPTITPLPGNLLGWAWSSTIGWVKLDPIQIQAVSGNLIGYAWSPNIGWIKFNGLSQYPAGGAPGVPANINLSTGEVRGWIRACAGTISGDCSSMVSRSDGWDGWIELAGANHPSIKPPALDAGGNVMSGVRMDLDTGYIKGMAWGGEVVGWLNFNVTPSSVTPPFTATCVGTNLGNGTVRFRAYPGGGNGSYQYNWNNGAFANNPNTFVKNLNGLNEVSVPLSVREMGNNTTLVVSCRYSPPNNEITIVNNGVPVDPACSVSPANALVGNPVTFTINGQIIPASTYSYIWITGQGNIPNQISSHVHTYTEPMASYATQVRITGTDPTSGVYNRSVTYNCGNVTVSKKELTMDIGGSVEGIANKKEKGENTKEYRIKVGNNFTVKWDNTLDRKTIQNPAGYMCNPILDNKTSDWTGAWMGSDVQSSNVMDNKTADEVGTYKLSISCTSNTYAAKNAEVILKVISSDVKEI